MSQENTARSALQKLEIGEGLTDEELDMMLDFYTRAKETLGELTQVNPAYGFSLNEVCRRYEMLKAFERTRKQKVA